MAGDINMHDICSSCLNKKLSGWDPHTDYRPYKYLIYRPGNQVMA
jgi:hypothetical protein